jgi:thiamine-monophosphate kinase
MGAEPRFALISLSLRGTLGLAQARRLYHGIAEQATKFGYSIAGGDLSGTQGPITLTATLIGRVAAANRVLRRRGARPGWQIAVTGSLGAAAAGLRLLESGQHPQTPAERAWVNALLDPHPQVDAGRALVEAGVRVGGDISDGLYREIERLIEHDRLGATIDIERLPLAPGLSADEWQLAVRESEDFQLICAGPEAHLAAARRALERIDITLTVIGDIHRQPGIRFRRGTRTATLENAGYEHFR